MDMIGTNGTVSWEPKNKTSVDLSVFNYSMVGPMAPDAVPKAKMTSQTENNEDFMFGKSWNVIKKIWMEADPEA
jgi:hypothetical protein